MSPHGTTLKSYCDFFFSKKAQTIEIEQELLKLKNKKKEFEDEREKWEKEKKDKEFKYRLEEDRLNQEK